MSSDTLSLDIAEYKSLLSQATRPSVLASLQSLLTVAVSQLASSLAPPPPASVLSPPPSLLSSAVPPPSAASASAVVARPLRPPETSYVVISTFLFDAGEYNSPSLSLYVNLDGIGKAKETVTCDFTPTSFDLKIKDFEGKSHRLYKDNLEHDLVPAKSSFIVKENKIVIKLGKVKGEYSFDSWQQLTAKKDKKSKAEEKADPQAGIMSMMKDLYNSGDDNMKKIIGESMLKSHKGEKPDKMKDFGKDDDDLGGGMGGVDDDF